MVSFPEGVVERQRWKVQAEDLYIPKKMSSDPWKEIDPSS
jgi:hypothetical protein